MKILSLFDGISCARVALERAGIPIERYYASEIDRYAIQISRKNYPDIVQLGSVIDIRYGMSFNYVPHYKWDIDLLIGGSPCQDLSIAKKDRKGLAGERSGLFWEYVRILREVKPKWFILENVASMPKADKEIITKELGVEPIMIDAALVSAQRRKRLFWTNIPNVTLPEDRGILLKDILEDADTDRIKSFCIDANYWKGASLEHYLEKGVRQLVFSSEKRRKSVKILEEKANTITSSYRGLPDGDSRMGIVRIGQIGKGGQGDRIYSTEGKSVGLSALGGGRGAKTGLYAVKDFVRKLTPIECERLQGLPEIQKSCIIRVCKDNQKNRVNAENQNHKSLFVAGNVEKIELGETVLSVEKSLNVKPQQISNVVQPDVLINCEENKIEIFSQGKLLANVSGAELKNNAPHLKSIDDFVHLVVGLNTIVERTITTGKEELHQKNNLSVVKENGNSVVSLYGKGITQLANDAKKDSITLNKLLKSITSDHSIQESKEQIIQILFSYVVNVIFGYIPKEILNQNISTFQIKSKVGYTYSVSNTQRYKALGNAFNVDVVAHILSFIPR